jgi:adenine-specific DNA methylase
VDGAVVETEAPPPGTVQRGRATCPACGAVHEGRAVRAQLRERRGGGRDALLRAVVTTTPGASGRRYRPPAPSDRAALEAARAAFDALPPGALPDEPMNARDPNTVAGRGYGIRAWGDLFTFRQAVTLAALVEEVRAEADPATRACLALALGRMANALTSLSRWHVTGEKLEGAFGRQALPMVWDFAEANPFSGASGGLANAIEWVAAVAEAWPGSPGVARALCADAARLPLDDASQDLLFTDPPYYGAIAYAELSDHFYVWLKRALPGDGLFGGPLTPKDDECIETPHAPGGAKDRAFFEERMERALREARRALRPAGVGCVVFANLGAEGWEAMLTALVRAGWSVSAAWPLVTELPVRNNARDTRALATSLHLVLRPRPEGAPDGSWESIERELPARTAAWRARLAREGVAGLDLACASLVPALALYTAHPRVRDAQGREVPARALVERFIA